MLRSAGDDVHHIRVYLAAGDQRERALQLARLWSLVAVWGVGHWFFNREQHLGARVLVWRFLGAILLMAVIVMVLLEYGRSPPSLADSILEQLEEARDGYAPQLDFELTGSVFRAADHPQLPFRSV